MHSPPAVLAGTYVVAYAQADDSVTFVQRNNLAVDGEWLGRVPFVAICQDFETSEFIVQFCDTSWDTVGIAAGYKTIEEAKRRTELSYVGIGANWQDSATSKKDAYAQHQADLKLDNCSFCGRTPLQVASMVGSEARICNHCIESFYKALHGET
jgi:ClpX C4-type zinc finger